MAREKTAESCVQIPCVSLSSLPILISLTQVYAEMSGRENGSNDLMQLRYAF